MNDRNNSKTMSDEQLEAVAGGDATVGGYRFSGPVGKYSGVVGRWYYIVSGNSWKYGKLYDSKEERVAFGTKRVHYFDITLMDGVSVVRDEMIFGDDVTLYTTMEKL